MNDCVVFEFERTIITISVQFFIMFFFQQNLRDSRSTSNGR